MTSNKRSAWRRASRDLATTNHVSVSRARNTLIPSGLDPAIRLAAVQANLAAKRNNDPQPKKDDLMPDISRQDLINALTRLTDAERTQIQIEVTESESRKTKMDQAAQALADWKG